MACFMDAQKEDKPIANRQSHSCMYTQTISSMVPPDFNRTGSTNLSFAKNFDHDPDYGERAQRLFYPAPGRLFSWCLVLLGLFGLKVRVLHFRNVRGV